MRNCRNFRIHLLFILTILVFKSFAQESNTFLGIKGGIAIPNLTARGAGDNPLNTGYSSRLGPNAAVFYEYAVTSGFSIMSGIEYASEGGKRNGFQAFPFPQDYTLLYTQFFPGQPVPPYLYADFNNEIKLNYLMVNVLAKFNWHLSESSPVMVYGEIGPFGAYLLSAKDVTSGSSIVYADAQKKQSLTTDAIPFDSKLDFKDQARKGNFGIAGDIGFAYNLPGGRIFIEVGGNYGLLNIQKDAANGKNQIGAVIGRVGYAFPLGSRY